MVSSIVEALHPIFDVDGTVIARLPVAPTDFKDHGPDFDLSNNLEHQILAASVGPLKLGEGDLIERKVPRKIVLARVPGHSFGSVFDAIHNEGCAGAAVFRLGDQSEGHAASCHTVPPGVEVDHRRTVASANELSIKKTQCGQLIRIGGCWNVCVGVR